MVGQGSNALNAFTLLFLAATLSGCGASSSSSDSTTPAAATAPKPPVAAPAPATAPAPASTAPSAAGPGDVPSPLSGRVTAIVVKVGQEVKEGDHLLTLEAMKMNTFVFAPKAGKVLEIKVAVADAVEEHQALVKVG